MSGFLWIINATSKVLKAVGSSNHQMKAWKFDDIPSQSKARFHVQYSSNLDTGEATFQLEGTSSTGEATFQLEGTSSSFQLLFRSPKKEGECGLKVDWNATITSGDYIVFPPALEGETFGNLGWILGGSLSLLIMENGVAVTVSTDLPGEDSIVPSTPSMDYPASPLYGAWMDYYSGPLGKLTLEEMTLPGTHDSGTYEPAIPVASLWVKTQAHSLAQQLSSGIRVLDLRIGQNSPGNYILCHHKWKTSYSLAEALKEVRDFIDSSNKEIVILDFHNFVIFGGGSYDYSQLKQQIASGLSGYCLPVSTGSTLASIWSSPESKRGRVVVAWNADSPDPYMWPGVNQKWYENADSLPKLYQCIKTDMLSPPMGLWATCSFKKSAALATPKCNAKDTAPTISNWYFGGSEFCNKANIISVDFFKKFTNVVQASIVGSLLIAGKKL